MECKKEKNRSKKTAMPLLACVTAAALAAGAGVCARYIHQRSQMNAVAANEFYFTSDFLSKEGRSYTLSSSTDSLTVELRNFADAYRRSGKDINYSYEVKRGRSNSCTNRKWNHQPESRQRKFQSDHH